MKLGFLLIDGYALMSTSAAVEPLRAANLLASKTLYDLRFLSPAHSCAMSSVGSYFKTEPIAEAGTDFDLVFVVAGGEPLSFRDSTVTRYLKTLDARRVSLGGISGGAAILALAGLMENRRFTLHWQHIDALRDLSDRLLIERRLFVIDRDRYTCAGGVAPLDMMHAMVSAKHGARFARSISDWFIHTEIRPAEDPQRAGIGAQYNVQHPALLAAIELMNSHIADPLSLGQLGILSGIGVRQLERLSLQHLGQPLMRFYREMRLQKADELVQQSALALVDVGLAIGCANASHFSRLFKGHFGITPKQRRARPRPTNGG
ncbi:MAG: helix-turn-helix domain-containing protein [Notoacmeibacter sp.]|nr:helix-turn-helix domain-containing protein [Notoacmeibacter sp.]